jgi:hypothetical protein
MKGGGLYGTPAAPASIAIPVGAALAGTAAAVGTVAAVHKNYKRLPQNVRDRCNAAIQEIKEALESQAGGGDPDLFIDELLTMDLRSSGQPVFDIITEHLVGNNTDQGGKKLPMILSRHFDTALMEHANKETPEEKEMGLKAVLMKMKGGKSHFQMKLILMGGLRTTESLMRRSHRKGGKDAGKMEKKLIKQLEKEQVGVDKDDDTI